MKKYIFSEKVDKKTTKYEIVAETLTEAQEQLAVQLETIRGINVVGVGLPDYIEPIDPPTDVTLKTFNITYRPDPDNHDETETITYKAQSMTSAEGQFLEDYPDQAGRYRETHSPLSNYAVDRENAKIKSTESEKLQEELEPIDMTTTDTTQTTHKPPTDESEIGFFDKIFAQTKSWVTLFTTLFLGLIGLGLVSATLFGVDGGFGIVENISVLVSSLGGLTGLVVLFLVYYLFIRCGDKGKT